MSCLPRTLRGATQRLSKAEDCEISRVPVRVGLGTGGVELKACLWYALH